MNRGGHPELYCQTLRGMRAAKSRAPEESLIRDYDGKLLIADRLLAEIIRGEYSCFVLMRQRHVVYDSVIQFMMAHIKGGMYRASNCVTPPM